MRRAPKKYLDSGRTKVSPEWFEWADEKVDEDTFAMTRMGYRHDQYFPEAHGKLIPEEGAWILVIEVPHTELSRRFEVPLLSLWRARPHVLNDGAVHVGPKGYQKHLLPHQAVIATPAGDLHLWPHEYAVISDPYTLAADPDATIHLPARGRRAAAQPAAVHRLPLRHVPRVGHRGAGGRRTAPRPLHHPAPTIEGVSMMTTTHPAQAILDHLGVQPEPPIYQTDSRTLHVPVERFGSDHWSTFAYVEIRIVDYQGRLDADHLRVDADRHHAFAAAKRIGRMFGMSDTKYPTRLKGGVELPDHDDVDCLEDLIVEGLLVATLPPVPTQVLVTGLVESETMTRAVWSLTERGQAVAGQLRAHKGNGGNFRSFEPTA